MVLRGLVGTSRPIHPLARNIAKLIPYRDPPPLIALSIGAAAALAGAGLRLVLDPIAHGHIPVVVFYPFVLVASIWGGTASGITAWLLGSAIALRFWLPPSGNGVTLVAFSLVCLFGVGIVRLLRALVEIHTEGEQRAVLLAHEVNHRANNLLGIVQSISAQTARSAVSVADYQVSFETRLSALARAQTLLAENPQSPPDLRAFLLRLIGPFGPERFHLEGPACSLPQTMSTGCALLVHELSTNSTKYGALSVPQGSVSIEWTAVPEQVRLNWREVGGPRVVEPTRTGFGSRLLRTAFPPDHGSVSVSFHPDGLQCAIEMRLLSQ